MYFRKHGLRKTGLDNCIKSPVSEDSSTSNMVNEPKLCGNLNSSTSTICFDKASELEKVGLTGIQNPKTVC